jgi:hypothetical protein
MPVKKWVAWVLVFLVGVCGVMANSADVVQSQYTNSIAAYKSAATAADKVNYLVGLINSDKVNSHGAFYEAVRTAGEEDILYIGEALKQAKGPAVLLNLGAYLDSLKASLIAGVKKNTKMGPLEVMELQREAKEMMATFQPNIEKLLPEIAIMVKKDPQLLVTALKRIFSKGDAEDNNISGPVLGIASMEADGAVLTLKSFGDNNDESKSALLILCKVLGPHMVLPVIKQYENPASSDKERDTAHLAMFMFPDVEPVYDQVVEAYRHGRYFPAPELKKNKDGQVKISLEDALAAAVHGWGNIIKGRYRKVEGFVPYVAEKHLDEPRGQERIIELLADINFGEAAPYFLKLDISELSKESIGALVHACHVSMNLGRYGISETGEGREYKVEKFRVFELLFKGLDPKARTDHKLIYRFSSYLPRNQVAFVKANVGIMTEDEKKTVAYGCGSTPALIREPIPVADRKAILEALKQGASPDLLEVIDFMSKE